MLNFVGILLKLHRRRLQLRLAMWVAGCAIAVVTASQGLFKASRYPYRRHCSVHRQAVNETYDWQARVAWFMFEHGERCPGGLEEFVRSGSARHEHLFDAWGHAYELTCRPGIVRVCSRGADEHDPGDDICGGQ